jgi:hypothetical protein
MRVAGGAEISPSLARSRVRGLLFQFGAPGRLLIFAKSVDAHQTHFFFVVSAPRPVPLRVGLASSVTRVSAF